MDTKAKKRGAVVLSALLAKAGARGVDVKEARAAVEKEIGKVPGNEWGPVVFMARGARGENKYYCMEYRPRKDAELPANGTATNATVEFSGDLSVTIDGAGMKFRKKKASKVIVFLASLIGSH